ncbi:MAG: hypothetical protein ACM33B_06095 [Pseudomonadota bacterium]
MSRLAATCRRLADEREVRIASLAAVPLLWVAIAWRDVLALVLTPVAVWVAALALRALARRRGDEDELIL